MGNESSKNAEATWNSGERLERKFARLSKRVDMYIASGDVLLASKTILLAAACIEESLLIYRSLRESVCDSLVEGFFDRLPNIESRLDHLKRVNETLTAGYRWN